MDQSNGVPILVVVLMGFVVVVVVAVFCLVGLGFFLRWLNTICTHLPIL